ncbi:MAG: hypothetical protein LBN42_01255 [Oscillospiraceae bacterium]|jgi:hypothetical protein|nr:hypothetical protein [Oscillospiraceae bacterium]
MILENITGYVVKSLGGAEGDTIGEAFSKFSLSGYMKDIFGNNPLTARNVIIGAVIFLVIYLASDDNYAKNKITAFLRTFFLVGCVSALSGAYEIFLRIIGSFGAESLGENASAFYVSEYNLTFNPFTLMFLAVVLITNYHEKYIPAFMFGAAACLVPLLLPEPTHANAIFSETSTAMVFAVIIRAVVAAFICAYTVTSDKADKISLIFFVFYFLSDILTFIIFYQLKSPEITGFNSFADAFVNGFGIRHLADYGAFVLGIVIMKIYGATVDKTTALRTEKDPFKASNSVR